MLTDNKKGDLKRRLRKVSGQINGIDKMIDEGRYCIDILQQVLAAKAALNKIGLIILESHAKSCLVNAIKLDHGDKSIEELMNVIKQFNK